MLFAAIWVVLFILIAVLAWNLTPEQFEDIQAAKQWLGFKGYSVVLLEEYEDLRKEKNRILQERELLERNAKREDIFWKQYGR